MTGLASNGQLRMSFFRYLLVSVPLVLLLGLLSGQIAGSGYGNPWFDALVKPSFMPPGWVFGLVWTVLYIVLGIVLAMILHARGAKYRGALLALFVVQLLLNYSWSPIFFAAHQIGLALIVIAAMIVLTLLLIALLWRVRTLAALLLLPYLAWLCFATVLTFTILQLNPSATELVPAGPSANIAL